MSLDLRYAKQKFQCKDLKMSINIFYTEEVILSSIKEKTLKRGLYIAEDYLQCYLKFLLN